MGTGVGDAPPVYIDQVSLTGPNLGISGVAIDTVSRVTYSWTDNFTPSVWTSSFGSKQTSSCQIEVEPFGPTSLVGRSSRKTAAPKAAIKVAYKFTRTYNKTTFAKEPKVYANYTVTLALPAELDVTRLSIFPGFKGKKAPDVLDGTLTWADIPMLTNRGKKFSRTITVHGKVKANAASGVMVFDAEAVGADTYRPAKPVEVCTSFHPSNLI